MKACLKYLLASAFIAVILAVVPAVVPSYAANQQPEPGTKKHITESYHKQTVSIKKGDALEIALAGNPTTGYSWVLDKIDGKSVRLKGKINYKPNEPVIAGSSGTFVARFQALHPGNAVVKMSYRRPWEKTVAPVRTFVVKLIVARR